MLIRLIREGWITHLATNGAGIIHDWELAYQGSTSEDVRENVSRGEFGTWEDTGRFINLALLVGAWNGLGYGQSVGALIANQGLELPSAARARRRGYPLLLGTDPDKAAAGADLLAAIRAFGLPAGRLRGRRTRFPVTARRPPRGVWASRSPVTR